MNRSKAGVVLVDGRFDAGMDLELARGRDVPPFLESVVAVRRRMSRPATGSVGPAFFAAVFRGRRNCCDGFLAVG